MRALLLLLLPAVAVGGEATYCTQLSDTSIYCITSTPIDNDGNRSLVTENFERREEKNRDNLRSIQEDLDRSRRDRDDTRSD